MVPTERNALSSFYRDLQPVSDFQRVFDASVFTEAPDDWSVILTDVRGSTKAIEEGRYRDVNMMGAAGLAAIRNALPELEVPCVFGGDGATMLVPTQTLPQVRKALEAVQSLSIEMFNLELRAGAVSIADLHRENVRVQVTKYELAPGNSLAQFRGGGLALAESWIKNSDPRAMAFNADRSLPANLTGLSCRWQPFKNTKGCILTLLVLVPGDNAGPTYSHLVEKIESIIGSSLKAANPARAELMHGKWPSMSILREARLHSSRGLSMRQLLKWTLIHAYVVFIVRFNIKIGGFDPMKYRQDTALNSDHKKFDDMLRLVIDCSPEMAEAITKELKSQHATGKAFYGHHLSNEALMTCFVTSTANNGHVHFIDGSDGGYALAAKELKAQMGKA